MTLTLNTPDVLALDTVIDALRRWQRDDAPLQLHPGDVGWFWRFGAETTAAALRTWERDGAIQAVGLLDGPDLLRLAIDPDAHTDEALAKAIVASVSDPAQGVLPTGERYVEAPVGVRVRDALTEAGWKTSEPWTLLRHDLTGNPDRLGVRITVTRSADAAVRAAVQRASFERSTFTDQLWRTMATGPAYADARCLVAHDDDGNAVAGVTIWSAGAGRPGLLEPMGVHRDFRGRGYGHPITSAAVAGLRELGSSRALVATPASNRGGVATYLSAGFERLRDRRDLHRS